jgi:hypothetical protein
MAELAARMEDLEGAMPDFLAAAVDHDESRGGR